MHSTRIASNREYTMIEDEIVREVRAAREAFAASHGYNIQKMVAALHLLGVASGRELVRLAPRKVGTSDSPISKSPESVRSVEH